MSDCDWIEERLPLLRYADELAHDERVRVLVHLEGCAGCRAARTADEATAAALDAAPLRHPGATRLAGLKASVLAAVAPSAPCPREVELVDAPDPAHVAACASCGAAARDWRALDQALDQAPPLPRVALAAQRAALVARFAAPEPVARRRAPAPTPRAVTRWPTVAVRAAAAVLLLGGVFGASSRALRSDAPGEVELLALAKEGADVVVRRAGDATSLRQAAKGYAHVAAHVESHRARDQRALAIAYIARREAEALEALARADHGSREGLEAVVAEHPEAPATLDCAFVKLQGLPQQARPAVTDATNPHAFPLDEGADPWASVRAFVKSPRAQAALMFQRGVRLEEDGRLLEARDAYQRVVALGIDAPAVALARARLARL